MSADNWATCPVCKSKADAKHAQMKSEAENAYGKLPPDQWLALKENAEKPVELESTLREDYCIGISKDGKFYAEYQAKCSGCGFSFEYLHTEDAMGGK